MPDTLPPPLPTANGQEVNVASQNPDRRISKSFSGRKVFTSQYLLTLTHGNAKKDSQNVSHLQHTNASISTPQLQLQHSEVTLICAQGTNQRQPGGSAGVVHSKDDPVLASDKCPGQHINIAVTQKSQPTQLSKQFLLLSFPSGKRL